MDIVLANCSNATNLDLRTYNNVTKQWILHPNLNCCCNKGAKSVPGPEPYPSGTSDPSHPWIPKQLITLQACQRGCTSDPLCTGILTGKYEPAPPPDQCSGAPTQYVRRKFVT
jgi:hypothetical protein